MATLLPSPQRATARLRIRQGAPSTSSPRTGYVESGTIFSPLAEIAGESVAGNALRFELSDARFVWSGASAPAVGQFKPPPTTPMDVPRRPDNGAIGVLSDVEREAVFGRFPYQEGVGGRIKIDPAWTKANLTTIATPLLEEEDFAKLTVHVKAAQAFTNVFAKIAAAGSSPAPEPGLPGTKVGTPSAASVHIAGVRRSTSTRPGMLMA